LYAYSLDNPVSYIDPTGQSWKSFWSGVGNWFQEHCKEVVIGTVFIVSGAIVTALTCGTGLGFMAAFGSVLWASAGQVAISMVTSVIVGGLVTVATGGGFFDNIGNSFASGFMWGGIFAGGAQMLSCGFKVAAEHDFKGFVRFLDPDRVRTAKEIAKLADKGQKFFDSGTTLIGITRNLHLDVSTKAFLDLAAFGFKHIPIGSVMAGIFGGL
jgi:hypothetical protein